MALLALEAGVDCAVRILSHSLAVSLFYFGHHTLRRVRGSQLAGALSCALGDEYHTFIRKFKTPFPHGLEHGESAQIDSPTRPARPPCCMHCPHKMHVHLHLRARGGDSLRPQGGLAATLPCPTLTCSVFCNPMPRFDLKSLKAAERHGSALSSAFLQTGGGQGRHGNWLWAN